MVRTRGGTLVTSLIAAASLALIAIAGAAVPAWSAQSLWIADDGADVLQEFKPAQLRADGSPTPVAIGGSDVSGPTGLAFDRYGNLWAIADNELLEYTPKQMRQLGSTPAPTPVAVITSTSFSDLTTCFFDKAGNLWAIDYTGATIDEITKAQLKAGTASVTPAVIISSAALLEPYFGTFDRSGNLWVTDITNYQILEFKHDQLSAGGPKTPDVVLSDDGTNLSIYYPGQIEFDRAGNLWVANYSASDVVKFARSQLIATGNPTPVVELTATSTASGDNSLDGCWGLTVDGAGNVWVANYSKGDIVKFTGRQIKVSGSPTPAVLLYRVTSDPYQLTFGPVR